MIACSYGWKDHPLAQPKPFTYTVIWEKKDRRCKQQVTIVKAMTAEEALTRVRFIAGFECFAQVCKIERVPL